MSTKRERKTTLKKLINDNLIDLNISTIDKKAALKRLSELLFKNNRISDVNLFIESIYCREKKGSTNIGCGVAIPHGVSKVVLKSSLTIGKLNDYINWDENGNSNDHPVCLIIVFAIKANESDYDSLKLLSQVSSSLAYDELLVQIKSESNKEEIIHLLEKGIAKLSK